MIDYLCFPGGKRRIVTFSYDDGPEQDVRLVALFNKYGVKATFHLNSRKYLDCTPEQIAAVRDLYSGHEIACHSVHHGYMTEMPAATRINETIDDRRILERIAGYPVTGMSYPYGAVNDDTVNALRACGITYSRTINSTEYFAIPQDFLRWNPTCHHKRALWRSENFIENLDNPNRQPLFYIWGHSFEFVTEEDWAEMETLVSSLAGKPQIWYATNGEIVAYRAAQRALIVSADETMIHNPSAIDVWVNKDREPICIPAGQTVILD